MMEQEAEFSLPDEQPETKSQEERQLERIASTLDTDRKPTSLSKSKQKEDIDKEPEKNVKQLLIKCASAITSANYKEFFEKLLEIILNCSVVLWSYKRKFVGWSMTILAAWCIFDGFSRLSYQSILLAILTGMNLSRVMAEEERVVTRETIEKSGRKFVKHVTGYLG
jgi:hypothetical protein